MATIAIDRERLAWCAGFFDGEGNVGHHERRTRRGTAHRSIVVQVTQSHPGPLDYLAATLGVGAVSGPYATMNPRARPYYVWRANDFEKAQQVACLLWPWLHEVKRAQFAAAFAAYRAFVPDVAPCEHGNLRQSCFECRSEWSRRGWENRKAVAVAGDA